MITTFKNRYKEYTRRKVLKLGHNRIYYFYSMEAPKTGYYRKTESGYIAYFTALKYSCVGVF